MFNNYGKIKYCIIFRNVYTLHINLTKFIKINVLKTKNTTLNKIK